MFIRFTVLFTLFIFANALGTLFPVGDQHSYQLTNDVFIKDFKDGKPIAYRLTGTLKIVNILSSDDSKLLKLTLVSPQLHVRPHGSYSQTEFSYHRSPIDNYKNNEFYGIWQSGNVSNIYFDADENVALINVKKGILSLLQFNTKDGENNEDGESGRCAVTYRETSPTSMRKLKRDCVLLNKKVRKLIRPEQSLQVSVQSHRSTDIDFFADGSIGKIHSRDYFHIALEANSEIGGSVDSVLMLKSDASVKKIDGIDGQTAKEFLVNLKNYKSDSLETDLQQQAPVIPKFKKVLNDNIDGLTTSSVGTLQAAKSFLSIVPSARDAKKADLVQILKLEKFKDNLPQILDILGAAQTTDTHAAVKEVLKLSGKKDIDNIERYLQALAIGTNPNAEIIRDLLKIVVKESINEKVEKTMVHTLGSMAYRYARLPNQNYSSKVVQEVQNYINKSLSECKDASCHEQFLNGLNNLQSTDVVSVLFSYVNHSERSVSVAAMRALARFPVSMWNLQQIQQFENVFFQEEKKFDSSTRTLALDVMLNAKLSDDQLKKLISHLKTADRAFEVKKYLSEKIQMLSGENADFGERVKNIIRGDSTLNNYHIIAQKGLTTALSRKYATESPFDGTLTSIQEIFGGVLKRGVVDMTIDSKNNKYSYFTLGLYSGGLSSFVSSGSDSSEETDESQDDTANAGMEITVQGSYLRPLEFFRGQGELMGHVWSGTASEPTPAYVASSLLHSHQESLQLQNGATISIDVVSALSIDLHGAIQLSLWNRNAQIQVNKNTGLYIDGKILVNAGFVTLDLNFNVEKEPKLNLNTDVDFSVENILCMQLSQPDDIFRYEIEKNQIIPEIRHHVKTIKKFKYNILGITHYLNKENNKMCNKILEV